MKKQDIDIENWALMLKTYNRVLRDIKQDLKSEGLPSLEVYDVLWTLARADQKRLRLQELGEKVDLEKFNVTRLVDKMVKEKLLQKTICDDDKRGTFAVLTEKGEKFRTLMWSTYRKSILQHFGEHLSHEDTTGLLKILKSFRSSYLSSPQL